MNKKFLYWLPRILGILFAIFISIFALDAFGEGNPFLEAVVGFLIHLIPTYIVIAVLLIAWKWELVGGILFILVGASYLVWAHILHWTAFLLIGGPPILIGILFIAAHLSSKRARKK
jgi:hypothetical protein